MNDDGKNVSVPIVWSNIKDRDPRGLEAEKIALVKALIDNAIEADKDNLERMLFGPPYLVSPYVHIPRPWWQWRLERVRMYVRTLWLALRTPLSSTNGHRVRHTRRRRIIMAKLTATVEATTDIELAPRLKRRLLQELTSYAELEKQLNELTEEKNAVSAVIEELREEADAKAIDIDGKYRITRVDGQTSKSLNKKKVYALGVTPEQFASCYVEKPKKAYTLLTTPNSKSRQKKADSDDE